MNIAVLDGTPAAGGVLDGWLDSLGGSLRATGHSVSRIALREKQIYQCHGCFDCFTKTPGRCKLKDDATEVLPAVVAADAVVFASPLVMGFTSATLKRATDRLLALYHPDMLIVNGEFTHARRYDRFPRWAVLAYDRCGHDDEDVEIVEELYRRIAFNMHLSLVAVRSTDSCPEELAREVDRL